MLADATAIPGTTQSVASRRESLKAGLGILDRAAKAFSPTQAIHLRRARYLSQLGDETEALREWHRAADVTPNSVVDHALAGLEQCHRGETKVAARSFQMALAQEPADFWSRCFLAVCQLKLNLPAQAQGNLTRCIAERPDLMWTRLLRGLAYSDLNAFGTAEIEFAAALKIGSDSDVKYAAHLSRGLMPPSPKQTRRGHRRSRRSHRLEARVSRSPHDFGQAAPYGNRVGQIQLGI